jgi:membrane-bound serine protease (ClpP class)
MRRRRPPDRLFRYNRTTRSFLRIRLVYAFLAALMCVAGTALLAQESQGPSGAPLVLAAEVDGIIHPVSAEFMIDTMKRADAERAALVVFTLRTPGGLVDSTREIVSTMIAARTPVAVLVAPSGARAASAGFILILAADVAAMAPGTHIGAAHPVSGTGGQMDEVTAKKAASDLAAYARTLAEKRGRNVLLAEQAVNDSRAFTEGEALKAAPPLVDMLASDVPDLLQKLDGRSITRFDGTVVVLHTASARVVSTTMNWRQRVLSAIAHPNVAYLLFTLGTLGLTIELWSPGAVLPGVVGGLALLLAFFAFQVLPINYAGLLLILFGLVLFALEVFVPSFGVLTVGGLLSLMFGSMMLMDSSVPEFQISLQVIVPVSLGLAGIAIFLVRLAVASQTTRPATGDAGMLDAAGVAITPIGPGAEGQVRTHGEIWRAVAAEPIEQGAGVRVTAVQGLLLTVRPDRSQPA